MRFTTISGSGSACTTSWMDSLASRPYCCSGLSAWMATGLLDAAKTLSSDRDPGGHCFHRLCDGCSLRQCFVVLWVMFQTGQENRKEQSRSQPQN